MDQLTKELDPEKRAQLQIQCNDYLMNNHVEIPVVDRASVNGHRTDLINTNPTPWDWSGLEHRLLADQEVVVSDVDLAGIAPPSQGMSRRVRLSLLALCALIGGSGILHFLVPAPYRRIVPAPLRPHATAVVAVSGVCELICAALLAAPRTRRFGAYATAALLVAVFPANIQMALDSLHTGATLSPGFAIVWVRLPLQYPLIRWALHFRRQG